tara:strand:- start:38 stop:1054 length:1017 start_codon:yes stop_codon:yes gene_type:complete
MAYWNPFGWDEETRRGIQSIVRPAVQVASFAVSMGIGSGGEAAANTGTPAAGATPETPFTPSPTDTNLPELQPAIEQQKEWLGQQGPTAAEKAAPGFGKDAPVPVDPQFFPEAKSTMPVPADSGFTQSPESLTGNTTPTDLNTQPFTDTQTSVEALHKDQGIDPNFGEGQVQQQAEPASPLVETIEARSAEVRKAIDTGGDPNKALKKYPVSPETGAKPTQTTTQQPGQAKPPATKTPNDKPPKPDGKGPGGKEKSFWEGGFNWKNIEKFLASDEGKKWMLSDKGLMGIGRRISQASEGGTSAFTALTPEERKKLLKKLKEAREKRKKDRLDNEEKNE